MQMGEGVPRGMLGALRSLLQAAVAVVLLVVLGRGPGHLGGGSIGQGWMRIQAGRGELAEGSGRRAVCGQSQYMAAAAWGC